MVQFLQEAVCVDKRREVKWSGNGTEERPETDVHIAMGCESFGLTQQQWLGVKRAGWGRGKVIWQLLGELTDIARRKWWGLVAPRVGEQGHVGPED